MSFHPSAIAGSSGPYISIVIPLYNEEESVEKLVARIVEVGSQFKFSYDCDKEYIEMAQWFEELTEEAVEVA